MFEKLQLKTTIKCDHEGGQVNYIKGEKQNLNNKKLIFCDDKIQFKQKVRVITFVSLVSLVSFVSSSCEAKMQAISPRENVQEISSAKYSKGSKLEIVLIFFC